MLDQAISIARGVAPGKNPEFSCMLVAAAVAGMRGLTMRHVKVGALFWPDHFARVGDHHLAICGGWGVYSYSARDGQVFLQEETLDDDGGFRGHTWVEDDGLVIDPLHGVDGGPGAIHGDDWMLVARWYRRPKLERLVKGFWRAEMQAALKAGRKLKGDGVAS